MKMKMIQVRWRTHLQAKRQAKQKNIPMVDYIQNLLDNDISKAKNGVVREEK